MHLKARLRTEGRWARRSSRDVTRPDFHDGPAWHPDLCLCYMLLRPLAAENQSKTVFLHTGRHCGSVHTDDSGAELLCGRLRCFRGLRISEEPFPMGLVFPLKKLFAGTEAHFLFGRFPPASLCPFPGAIFSEGLTRPEEPIRGYLPRAFATIVLTRRVLCARWGGFLL